MRIAARVLCICALWWAAGMARSPGHSVAVSDYTPLTGYGTPLDLWTDSAIVLRTFVCDNARYYLAVDPRRLDCRVYGAGSMVVTPAPWDSIAERFGETPYVKALHLAEAHGDTLQDAGLTHVVSAHDGIDLSVDLCPSRKPLDRALFDTLVTRLSRRQSPVPVAICVSGRWMKEHADDLAWLARLDSSRTLSIVWVNHTFTHPGNDTLPLNSNFILEKGIDVDSEALRTERLLIENGLAPSIFFRFPGLVSDSHVFARIVHLGLIPIGSDAWLAKGQQPTNGSIVLVHGNGNEPAGIARFITFLDNQQAAIDGGNWALFDLRTSVADDANAESRP